MLELAWLGIALGASAALAIGPIFAAIVHESIARGFGAGLRVSLGATIVDLALLLPALLFAQALDLLVNAAFWIGLFGALVFLHRSGVAFRDAHRLWRAAGEGARSVSSSFYLGVVGNLTNPLTWGFWLATGIPALLRALVQHGADPRSDPRAAGDAHRAGARQARPSLLQRRRGPALPGPAGTLFARNILPYAFG